MGFDYIIYDIYREIEELYKKIEETKDIEKLKELYKYIKENNNLFYIENNIIESYKIVKRSIRQSEEIFDNDYIIDTKFKLKEAKINKDSNETEILDFIVNETRNYLLKCKHIEPNYNEQYEINLTNWCEKASRYVSHLCDVLNIKSKTIEVQPGFSMLSLLFNGCGFHFLNMIKIDKKSYIMDLTYSQFFKAKDCQIERLGILDYQTPKPGTFIDKKNPPKFIKEILKKGYTKLNDETYKAYMDLFTISFRNGLYYEQTNDFTYKTNYTKEDYINFLEGTDTQINHEGSEVLGFQKKPNKKQYEYTRITKNM